VYLFNDYLLFLIYVTFLILVSTIKKHLYILKKIWTNGCFDILHIGHIKILEAAKSRGDYLVVGIDSDKRVKNLKGSNRPFNSEKDRKDFLTSIKYVDEVVIFNSSEELEESIKLNEISEIVVGEEYKDREVIGSIHAPVFFFPRIGDHSTTKILER
jgi:rfaE bifunctional protein nucleotidyltransferase chain/domain